MTDRTTTSTAAARGAGRRRGGAALVVAVVATVLAGLLVATPGPAAGAAGYRPPSGGHFNNPNGGRDAQRRIEDVVVSAINHARKGDEIRISLFSFDRTRPADALIRAFRRGVAVQLLLNGHQTTRVMRKMRKVFGANRARRSFIYQCERGCRGGSFLHSKFYLFSRAGQAKDVVMVGSNNLTMNAQAHQWNDLLVMNDRTQIYKAFYETFEQMKLDKRANPLYQVWHPNSTTVLHVFPFRNATRTNDPLMKILEKVRCHNAARGYGTHGRTRIRIDQHRIGGERGAWIARRLVQLWGNGCDIKVMHGSVDAPVKRALRTRTKRGMIPVRANGFDSDRDGLLDVYTHHKYMTVSGNYGGDRSTKLVMTGSSNWAGIGVTGDEVIFLTESARYLRQYERNWSFIWNHGSRAVTYRRQARTAATYRSTDGSVVSGGLGSLLEQEEPRPGGKHWEND